MPYILHQPASSSLEEVFLDQPGDEPSECHPCRLRRRLAYLGHCLVACLYPSALDRKLK